MANLMGIFSPHVIPVKIEIRWFGLHFRLDALYVRFEVSFYYQDLTSSAENISFFSTFRLVRVNFLMADFTIR